MIVFDIFGRWKRTPKRHPKTFTKAVTISLIRQIPERTFIEAAFRRRPKPFTLAAIE